MRMGDPAGRDQVVRSAHALLALVPLVLYGMYLVGSVRLTPAAWAVLGVLTVALMVGLLYGEEPEPNG